MSEKYVNYSLDAVTGISRIEINRPEVNNALNRPTRLALKEIVAEIRANRDVKVVILSGAGGKAFIAGADVTEFQTATPGDIQELVDTLSLKLYTEIEELPMPVIAKIRGFCLGGGNEVAMSCDIRIASDDSKFGQPEISLGFIPGSGGTQKLPRLIGWGRAKELIYTGKIIDAAEAERFGLVDRVVPVDQLDETVEKLASSIAQKSPIAIRLAKSTINHGMYAELAAGLRHESKCFALSFTTEDHNEGIAAFLEKRKPQFRGR
ncbi:enoyl-CoA hydratase/isomerase family protein [Chloroflexota bacterium]